MAVLVPETAGRLDQHDRHIQALAETRNWKQVLTQIDKRLKKGKNPRLVINKALIQLRMSDPEARKAGCDLLRTTLASMSPVLDNDVLEAVEDTANSLFHVEGLREIASDMWETTLKAQPNNEELLLTVFEQKVAVGDWDAARKFCMTRMKNDRDWFLRWIVCVHLVAISKRSKAPEMVKKMNAGLATKSLAKAFSDAAKNVRAGSAQSHGGQAGLMRSSQDVDLLVEVYRKHEMYTELVQMLNEIDESGLSAHVGGRFAHIKDKIEALTLSKNWPKLLEFTKTLLQDARSSGSKNSNLSTSADDWAVWNAFITALSQQNHDEPEELKEAVKLLYYYINERKSLNARLACITLFLHIPDAANELQTNIMDLYGAYLSENGHKLFAFNQLKQSYLLPLSQKKDFLRLCRAQAETRRKAIDDTMQSARDWLTTELNSLKLEYYHVVSANNSPNTRKELLGAFVANCLRLYKVALRLESKDSGLSKKGSKEVEGPTERFVGDDAGILAAMALVHLWFDSDNTALLRCAFVLESVLSRSKHNYDAILLAVRVYLYMGQPARAAYLYKQLDAKNIQNLSVAWILTPRLSSLHPHRSKLWRDGPEAFLQGGCRWVMSSQGALKRAYNETLRHGSYRNFIRSVETFELSHQSIAGLTFATELERSVWSQGGTASSFFQAIETDMLDSHCDLRELASFPCYENNGGPSIETALRPGPLPQLHWMRYQLRSRYLRYVALGGSIRAGEATAMSSVFRGSDHDKNADHKPLKDLTESEVAEDSLVQSMYHVVLAVLQIAESKKQVSKTLKDALMQLVNACNIRTNWLSSSGEKQLSTISLAAENWHTAIRWDTFHWVHQQMYLNDLTAGLLHLVILSARMWKLEMVDTMSALVKSSKEIGQASDEFRTATKDWANNLQVELRQPEAIQQLVSVLDHDPAQHELVTELANGLNDAREFAINVANGWVDSLEAFTSQRKI